MKQKIKNLSHKIFNDNSSLVLQLNDQAVMLAETRRELESIKELISIAANEVSKVRNSLLQTGSNEVLIRIFNGQKVYASLDDVSVAPHLALDGIWEREITQAWLSVIKPNSVVFDVGANFGYYGLIASQQMDRRKSKVVYFEPNSNLIPFINKSLAVNWLVEGSTVENIAISDKKGTAQLSILKDYIGSSSLHSVDHLKSYLQDSMNIEATNTVTVKTNTLDEYCSTKKIDRVDLIKLDVEGFEVQAYHGMRKLVKRSSDMILFIEFTAKSYENPKEFFDLLKKDFRNIAMIDGKGNLEDANNLNYEKVLEGVEDWIMLVFSKNKVCDKKI